MNMTLLEIIATVSGIIAVSLQAKEKILAWPFAIVSVAISAYIFFFSKLYSDFGLHIIYIVLNVYGWYIWSGRKGNEEVAPTQLLTFERVVLSAGIILTGTFILGYIMSSWTDADLPYFDAFTTSGSLVAQYLLAKKYLQNWLFWIAVDVVAIPVYLYKELFFFSFLFAIYLLICIWGYWSWKKELASIEVI
jgi:nicotinamide mononucleotide transporter